MAKVMKTPGVYIVEKNAFPNSVVEVATAVPAFIGYTETADNQGEPLKNVPWRISSMAEFQNYFGKGPAAQFQIAEIPAVAPGAPPAPPPAFVVGTNGNRKNYSVTQEQGRFLLYYSMLLFFQNGGGPCYIVSVGTFREGTVAADALTEGIGRLVKEQEPTMVVIPDAVLLQETDCIAVQQAALLHCGSVKSRIAILDIYDGFKDRKDPPKDCVTAFRSELGIKNLDYAAAYYPWLNTSVVTDADLGYQNISNLEVLKQVLKSALPPATTPPDPKTTAIQETIEAIADRDKLDRTKYTPDLLNKTLSASSPTFVKILTEIKNQLNVLPPSGAMAGVYTAVDNSKGVWKAPANVSLNSVASPTVNISHDDQEDLNVDVQGKSINAIRSFIGEGVLVWGARTLDGNSLDWRYISVRRTMIMLEQSIKLATKAYVFENNDSTTWVTIKSMIRNFLTGIWKRGGLAGASPDDALAVFCGLGETMTPEDILAGILRVTVRVAVTHPAEFIEITFEQQMQKSYVGGAGRWRPGTGSAV